MDAAQHAELGARVLLAQIEGSQGRLVRRLQRGFTRVGLP